MPITTNRKLDSQEVFQVTHPFHPLSGKKFEVLRCRKIWGEERVTYLNAKGEARRIPLAWTSLALPDPFLTVSAGRSMLHVKNLLDMVALVREIRESKPNTVNKKTNR